jgi:hypothetical protein
MPPIVRGVQDEGHPLCTLYGRARTLMPMSVCPRKVQSDADVIDAWDTSARVPGSYGNLWELVCC